MTIMSTTSPEPRPYDLFMLGLSLYVLIALAAEAFFPLKPGTKAILGYADTGICMVFLGDFFFNLVRADNKKAYLKWGWIDLVSSIPAVGAARLGRTVRIIRILRILRAVRSFKLLSAFILRRRVETAFWSAALVSVLLVIFSSIAILEFESSHEGANLRGPSDAIWWAYVTITTVGYGDRYPITLEGRVVAALLMTAGVGFFGTFTGLVASWFLSPGDKKARDEMGEIQAQLAIISAKLDGYEARTDSGNSDFRRGR